MTKEELESTHPDYENLIDEWRFFLRSYMGGKSYKEGDYLMQHPFESTTNYNRRKETSYYYNYCGPIVDILVSHLFRKPARRDYGTLSGDPLFGAFLRDADLDGNTLQQFMRDAQRFASIYGRVSIVVDKPMVSTLSRAEAVDYDIRPYTALVTPENLVDWSFTRLPSGRPILDMVKIREARDIYRVWTRQGWELWEVVEDEVRLLGADEHGLGQVPVVNLYNKQSGMKMLGISDIQDIADVNKNIYYLCSDAKEIIENTAFPMLAMPYTRGGGEEERELGPRNILQFDPSEPNSKPYWLEPPHSSLSEIREWIKQDIAEIHRIAKMGGVKATEDFSRPRSGVALELEYQQLHAVLAEKADNIEQAETRILELWARWQDSEFDGVVDYPDDFSVRDLTRDLEKAFKAQSARVGSATFGREIEKAIAGAVLPKLDEELIKRIYAEIDAAPAASTHREEEVKDVE
ncbi:MAG: phage portal protein [Thermodesulfobacteriota bacterium]